MKTLTLTDEQYKDVLDALYFCADDFPTIAEYDEREGETETAENRRAAGRRMDATARAISEQKPLLVADDCGEEQDWVFTGGPRDSVWVTVGTVSVFIAVLADGNVSVGLYRKGREADNNQMLSAAFGAQAEPEDEEVPDVACPVADCDKTVPGWVLNEGADSWQQVAGGIHYVEHEDDDPYKGATSDAEWHAINAERAQTDPEGSMAELDAKYHDHLPEGANCRACGVEHAPINPQNL